MLEAPALNKRDAPVAHTLTVEGALYLALCLLALAVRLVGLSGSQLTVAEAAQALPAYRLAHGSGSLAISASSVSPGLLSIQALAFWFFSGNDAWARLPVALLTSLYPLAFWLLRPLVGRVRAVAAAAVLLISPVWVAAGTMGLAGELGVVACLFSLGFAVQAVERGDDRWLTAGGVALGLALAVGCEGWAALAFVGALLLTRRWLLRGSIPLSTGQWRRLGLATGVATLAFGTTVTLNPMGLQAVIEQAGSWLAAVWQRQGDALQVQALLLICYEPLLLYLGLLTIALVPASTAWRRLLYLWTALALLLTLANGKQGGGILLALPVLAILTAEALVGIARRLRLIERPLLLQGIGAVIVLGAYGYVAFTGFAKHEQWVYLLLVGTAIGIGAALLGLVGVRHGVAPALALAALALVTILGTYQIGATWQGAWQRRALPQELTYGQVADANLADLVSDITAISWSRTSHALELPITIEESSGALVAWYTRSLRHATWVSRAATDTQTLAVLTARPELEAGNRYVGQDFRTGSSWSPRFSDYWAFLRWLLYREAEGVQYQRATLWVLNDLATDG